MFVKRVVETIKNNIVEEKDAFLDKSDYIWLDQILVGNFLTNVKKENTLFTGEGIETFFISSNILTNFEF